jgi:hypothetical protein
MIDDDCNGTPDDGDNCYCDINMNGVVNFTDVIMVRGLLGETNNNIGTYEPIVDPYDKYVFLDADHDNDIDSLDYKTWLNRCYIQQ